MLCPKCGHVQPDAPECVRCGVIIAKALAAQRRRERPETEQADRAPARPAREPRPRPAAPPAGGASRTGPSGPPLPPAGFRSYGLADKQRAALFLQLSRLIAAGIPTDQALRSGAAAVAGRRMQAVCLRLAEALEGGALLSQAMRALPRDFDVHESGTIASAERMGDLPPALDRLRERLERRTERRRKLLSGVLYPLIVLNLSFFLLPLAELVVGDPAAYASRALTPFAIFWGSVAAAVFLKGRLATDPRVGPRARAIATRVPVLSAFLRAEAQATYCEHAGQALAAGLPIETSLESAAEAAAHPRFARATESVLRGVDAGQGFAEAFRATRLFGDGEMLLIAGGERSGDLAESLRTIARHTEDDLRHNLKVATRIATVLLSVLILGFVGLQVYGGMSDALGSAQDALMKEIPPGLLDGAQDLESIQEMLEGADEVLRGPAIRPMGH